MFRKVSIVAGALLAFLLMLRIDATIGFGWLGDLGKVLGIIGICLLLLPWVLLFGVISLSAVVLLLVGAILEMRRALRDGGEFGLAYWKGFFTALLLTAIFVWAVALIT